jgi:RecA-family ATPase
MLTTLEIAKAYQRRGWQPIPIAHRSKNPNFPGWQKFETTESDLPKHFNGAAQNIGVLLRDGLIDIDLDSPEAVKIADYFLPQTEAEFGRAGKPRSHRLYYCKGASFEKFNNPFLLASKDEGDRKRACIAEFRTGDGLQTVFPGSTHETSGEAITWSKDGEPLQTDAQTLRWAVARLTSACLISIFWREGVRNELNLALSGALLRNGFDVAATKNFIRAVCAATDDEETTDRLKAVDATAEKLKRGAKVAGFPILVGLTDKKLVETVCKWLQIESRQDGGPVRQKGDPAEFSGDANQNEKAPLRPLKIVKMSDVKAEKVEWLWNPFIPLGTLTLIDGEEGIGKSLIALQGLGVAVAAGKKIDTTSGKLVFTDTDASNVLVMSAEESLSFVVKPRLQAVDAPCERFVAVDEPFTLDNDGIIRLSMAIAEYEPKLVIIDPLFSYTGKVRLNDDNEIRSITDPLTRLAEKFGCAIVGIRHINKSKGFGDARNAGLNGVGWRAAARSALLVGIDKETGETAIVQTKTNLAEKSKKAFGYKIESAQIPLETGEFISAPKLYWTGESDLTAETMLSQLRNDTGEEKSEKQDAISFLNTVLNDGEKPVKDIQAEARQIGISEKTLQRAKSALKIKSRKEDFKDGKWFWCLPEGGQVLAEGGQINIGDHLQQKKTSKGNNNNNLTEDGHVTTFGQKKTEITEDGHVTIFGQKEPEKTTEDGHVTIFGQTTENKTNYAGNVAEDGHQYLSDHLQQELDHLQGEDFYACLYCSADISPTTAVCPECDKPQLPSFG